MESFIHFRLLGYSFFKQTTANGGAQPDFVFRQILSFKISIRGVRTTNISVKPYYSEKHAYYESAEKLPIFYLIHFALSKRTFTWKSQRAQAEKLAKFPSYSFRLKIHHHLFENHIVGAFQISAFFRNLFVFFFNTFFID